MTQFNFELDDWENDGLYHAINAQRIKYMMLLLKCMSASEYLHEGHYTVQHCIAKIQHVDALESKIWGDYVCTHSEDDILKLERFYYGAHSCEEDE